MSEFLHPAACILKNKRAGSPVVVFPGSCCLLVVRICVHKDNSSPESGTSGSETRQHHTHVMFD